MKVCFVAPYAYSLFNTSREVTHAGAEMDLYFAAKELVQHPKYSVSFVTGDFGQPASETYDGITVLRAFRTNLQGFQRWLYRIFIAVPKLWQALQKANADIYVQEGAGFETGVLAFFCRMKNRRFVYRLASTIDCNGEFARAQPFVGKVFLYGLRRADAIVAQDHEEVVLLERTHQLASTPIYNTTPIPDNSEVVPTSDRRTVVWVSRLVRMKRPEIFLQLTQQYPDQEFVMVTSPDPNDLAFSEQTMKQAASIPNLEVLPRMTSEKLNQVYRQAKLFISTSDFEGYPNTFIEAGKYSVPVISLRVNPDGMFSDGQYGTHTNGDVNKFLATVGQWLDDASKREQAGKAFRMYVQTTHDIRKNVQQYMGLFEQLAARTNPS